MVADLARVVQGSLLAEVDGHPAIAALDLLDDPGPSVDRRAAELVADLWNRPLVHAPPELPALRALTDPDHVAGDARARRRRAAALPDVLRIERGLLLARDLAEREAELVGRRISPVPEAAPNLVDDEVRVEREGEGQERAVELVRELEQIELLGNLALFVGEERESGAEACPKGAFT
jgi:hypothetical protein